MADSVLDYEGLKYYHRNMTGYVDNGDNSTRLYSDNGDTIINSRIDDVEQDLDSEGLSLEEIEALTPIS